MIVIGIFLVLLALICIVVGMSIEGPDRLFVLLIRVVLVVIIFFSMYAGIKIIEDAKKPSRGSITESLKK